VAGPGIVQEARELIQRMSRENPLWGAPRSHGALLMLGTEVSESKFGRYIARTPRPRSQVGGPSCVIRPQGSPRSICSWSTPYRSTWNEVPKHLLRDPDGAFGAAYTRRIRAMAIRDHPIAPRSPWQNEHVERLIGSIRRECLDHIVAFGEAHPRRTLKTYAVYYNHVRTHLSLRKGAPNFRRSQTLGSIVAMPILGGLHQSICSRVSF